MPLQTRLSALITAIGADIKSLNTKFNNPALVGFGQLRTHGTTTDFNLISDFGYWYVQGALNGPNIPGAIQYYCVSLSLGSEYAYSTYVHQIAWPRTINGIFATRSREDGAWSGWTISNNVKVADSELLDGLDSTQFLRSTAKAADSELLDGLDSSAFLRTTGKAADAELLDGIDSSGFLRTTGKAADSEALDGIDSTGFLLKGSVDNAGLNTTPVSSLNARLKSGFYDGSGVTGMPDGNWWLVQVYAHNNNANQNYFRQVAYDMTGGTGRIMHRRCVNADPTVAGNWSAWERIDAGAFHAAGAKAADSELLDGLDSTAFLRTTAKAADSELLDGLDSTAFLRTTAKAADSDKLNGLTAASYLLTTGKAADSNLLDGIDSLGFIRKDVDIIDGGTP